MNWIKTTECMPEEKERVLLVVRDVPDTNEIYVCVGNRYTNESVPSGFQLDDDTVYDMIKKNRNITHWMPLPKPPQK